jgi:hypothetical protein
VHAFREVFVEDEAQDIVAEFIGVHFAPEGVGDVPELLFELLLVFLRHG